MKNIGFLVRCIVFLAILAMPVNAVFAAPEAIEGTVQSVTLETNTNTAVTTVLVTLLEDEVPQTVRISIDAAIALGLVTLGGDGNPVINQAILGQSLEIDPGTIITEEQEKPHPVAEALATFFSDIPDLDYETIMTAHQAGTGFGVIAQALWLTRKLNGNAEVFLEIINAKKDKDFSAFVLEDGSTPANWGQFKQAVLNRRNGEPRVSLANNDHPGGGNGNGNNGNNGNANNNGNGKNKNKDKDRENNRPRNQRDH